MKEENKKILTFLIILIGILALYTFVYDNYYMGNYIVQKQWISSDYNNLTYCNNCLWIEFSEGCNRYPVYYFENQHEFDKRLEVGKIVNIDFNGEYIRGISLVHKYRMKCFCSNWPIGNFAFYFSLLIFNV